MDRAYARTTLQTRLRALKQVHFGDPQINLHTVDIARARNGFESLADPRLRAAFYVGLNALMGELDYKVIACVINKVALVERIGNQDVDPYRFALPTVLEQFRRELGDQPDSGIVYAEKRGHELDHELEQSWEIMRSQLPGRSPQPSRTIDQQIVDVVLKDKRHKLEGLPLADLVVSPIGRHAMGYPSRPDWEIVQSKLNRSAEGEVNGWGIVWLP